MEETTCVEKVRKTRRMSGPSVAYTVRESSRAKRVIIKVWPSNQVEVVVPRGFNLSRLPDILNRESEWISDQKNKYHQMGKPFKPDIIDSEQSTKCGGSITSKNPLKLSQSQRFQT